jgi:hypothetical protein
MSELEQNLLFAASGIILLGTLVVFLWQWWSNRNRD